MVYASGSEGPLKIQFPERVIQWFVVGQRIFFSVRSDMGMTVHVLASFLQTTLGSLFGIRCRLRIRKQLLFPGRLIPLYAQTLLTIPLPVPVRFTAGLC